MSSTFQFEPMLGSPHIKVKYSDKSAKHKKNTKFLKQFYLIIESYYYNGETVQSLVKEMSILGEPVLFHKGESKIGTADFNIPTELTLESTSEEIGAEVKRFREARSEKKPPMVLI